MRMRAQPAEMGGKRGVQRAGVSQGASEDQGCMMMGEQATSGHRARSDRTLPCWLGREVAALDSSEC